MASEQDLVGFDIAVNDPAAVRVGDGPADGPEHVQQPPQTEAPQQLVVPPGQALEDVSKVGAFHERHQVVVALQIQPQIQQRDDGRMGELCGDLRLVHERPPPRFVAVAA